MKREDVYALINAGGSGTRFWPLSTNGSPKQFNALISDKTLLQETVSRLKNIIPTERIYIVCTANHKAKIKEQQPDLPPENIIAEPVSKNTSAAICLGTLLIHEKDPDAIIASIPSDHVIKDEKAYLDCLEHSFHAARDSDSIITIGIKPTRIETGFGYIKLGKKNKAFADFDIYESSGFCEKPSYDVAKKYIESGKYMWNAGIFIFKTDFISRLFFKHLPDIIKPIMGYFPGKSKKNLASIYENLTPISIDYGIMEKTKEILVIPCSCHWIDVGIWSSMDEVLPKDQNNNAVRGDNIILDSSDNIIFSTHTPIACIGVTDLIIVNTPNGVLVCDKRDAQAVRKISDLLNNK
jgi:mannose-1-phosphate guanylyltransferase